MAEPTKPTPDEVKARIQDFRKELIARTNIIDDGGQSLKELLIRAGYTNMRMAYYRDPLTLAELLDDLLLTIGSDAVS